ncbi:MAG TPA: helix-turn-helix domain-containing protein [Nocardioidaceae bacterium]|nr:helix-turn-helix domain-containing protein [Nocardioidaceae bacterium]
MPQKYLSLGDVAAMYGVTTRTVRQWVAEGRLPAKRINARCIRVRVDDADALGEPVRVVACG